MAQSVESDAKELAQGDIRVMDAYLDSMATEPVYPVLGYTYAECKKYEINLGLDLKGGMNVTLEVSIEDVVRALSGGSEDPAFLSAMSKAKQSQKNSQEDFVTLFERAFSEVNPGGRLTSIFYNLENKEKISRDATNDEVVEFIRGETDAAFDRSFEVIRTRVNLFGVAQPNIQKLEGSDRILVELPGVKNKERVRQLLQGTAKLEFWETFENEEIYPKLEAANDKLKKLLGNNEDEVVADSNGMVEVEETIVEVAETDTGAVVEEEVSLLEEEPSLLEGQSQDSAAAGVEEGMSAEEFAKENPLFNVMRPAVYQDENGRYRAGQGPAIGFVALKDTGKVNLYLNMPEIKAIFPAKVKFLWAAKPYDEEGKFLQLIAIKVNDRDGQAPLEGDVIVDAFQSFGQFGGKPEITMKMNAFGAKKWKSLTRENIEKSIAIVLDDYVYSYPTVQNEISGGVSVITGQFEIEEAQLIANILKAGKLPAPAKIVEEAIVGPSLGEEAINSGLSSFIIALFIVLLYMIFYYSKAGIASNVALLANLFFLMGVLASTNIALTLPGIAGIVLTIGMSVDANVLIYERIREEVRAGKGMRLAVSDGYSMAYSSIIDANVTTILTGIILWVFGSGPVEGFAKTLVIGIITSLFTAIFITRLIFTSMLDRNKELKFSTKLTENIFQNVNIPWISKRKLYYGFSSILIAAGLFSLVTKGLNYGVDFQGGRSFLVRFEQSASETDVRAALRKSFGAEPEVKTFGEDNQLKITTDYMIDNEDANADEIVEGALKTGLESMPHLSTYEIMSSQKVGPTIADDIKTAAFWSILFSMIVIFLYILLRFRKWQYGLGAIMAVFHDVLIVLGLFSLLDGIMPFSLEIDQAFIAAILTVVGYSINDTVVVFDRIREFLKLHKKQEFGDVVNQALNSTLSRTINTSLSTFFVLLMIFIFGGEVIRGFAFALLIGISVGTYSSLCVASPIVVDLSAKAARMREKKK
jgi:SecD/SecF fusion protein